MKFQLALFFFFATFLAVTSAEKDLDAAIYDAVPGTAENPENSNLQYQEYELRKEQPAPDTETGDLKPPNAGSYRICLAVKCFPKKWKYQVCRCVVWI